MKSAISKVAIVLVVLFELQLLVVARPNFHNRVKRVSENHLADLQTRIGIQKLEGVAITVPVGGGYNLKQIGRKRRSESRLLESLFNRSDEDQGDPIEENANDPGNYDDLLYNYK